MALINPHVMYWLVADRCLQRLLALKTFPTNWPKACQGLPAPRKS